MSLRRFDHRVRRLEAVIACSMAPPPLLILVGLPVPNRNLCTTERVVIDRFRHTGNVIWGQERITSDLGDDGYTSEAGGYIAALLEGFHQACHWRTVSGACRMCEGTSVAEMGATCEANR